MSRKPSLLATAIKTTEQPASAPEAPPEPQRSAPSSPQPAGSYVAPSRANKLGRTHFLPPAYWETLDEISFRSRDEKGKRIPKERLVGEALNLLFAKYNYPVVREGDE
ncbi:chromosome partitioning protein ParB [Manganibacter manganicus]|uniref:Chromosome partitioning protein ParB n=1 Tax=Manganibacter manganicus TaxID=1873176 RepID=A0A1V8RLM6_9HYPH|nr:chromosome partitioning protein ParB [Pseudaminobacter manganicus]OQM74102.1 chromosome partitioning protein ParB [Pseudaminobacter manganicus]